LEQSSARRAERVGVEVSRSYPFGLGLSKLCATPLFGLDLSRPGCARGLAVWSHAWLEGGGRVVAPAGDSLFFASPKKSKQKKGDPQSATPALRYGADLRRGGCGVRRGTRFALARAARTTTASPNTPPARAAAGAPPHPPRRRRSQQGVDSQTAEQPHGPSLARPRFRGRERIALRKLGRAQRSNGPCGCPLPGFPSVCAWGAQGTGWHARRSARASWSDSPQLFERSAPARSEFCGAPRDRALQVAP
jgi:hypothetical protein